MSDSPTKETVTIPLDVAVLVRNAFLPANPNKMRTASTETVDAAKAFISAVRDAQYLSKTERWVL